MIVNSDILEQSAAEVRRRKHGPQMIHAEGVAVSAAQLDTAAQILRDADPSVITSVRGAVKNVIVDGRPQERPGFIERSDQGDPEVLVFRVGIIPSELHRIDRRGKVQR